jgi:acetyl-CoA carboxylase carboxyl transferase subunit alpha
MPEGCATILWKDSGLAEQAAESLKLTSDDLIQFELVDEIVKEPPGGAHRNHRLAASILRRALRRHLSELDCFSPDEIIKQREQKFRKIGRFKEE